MLSITSLVLLSALSTTGPVELLEFSADWCPPCRMMQPIVGRLQNEGIPIRQINIDRDRELAARFGVTRVPCFVIVRGGREIDRQIGATSYDELKTWFLRIRDASNPSADGQALVRGQSPERSHSAGGRLTRALTSFPQRLSRRRPTPGPKQAAPPVDGTPDLPQFVSTTAPRSPAGPLSRQVAAAKPGDVDSAMQRAQSATVRLKVEDATGNSYGTGTVVDAHKDEALVLTCGHIFRESQGQGRITVDLFASGTSHSVEGRLVGYDLRRDVGLVTMRPGIEVAPVQVAGPNHRVVREQRVFSIGCDRGGEPRVVDGRILQINRYLGPPNLVATGRPIDGRSGGGLFTADGVLVGVCNAADPSADEGLYAAAGTIQEELDGAGLGFVYRRPAASAVQLAGVSDAPAMPTVRPNSESRPERSPSVPMLPRLPSNDSEIICIVRSRNDPQHQGRMLVINQPSVELLDWLHRESEGQATRQLASGASGRNGPPELRVASQSEGPAAGGNGRDEVMRGQTP